VKTWNVTVSAMNNPSEKLLGMMPVGQQQAPVWN